MTNYDFIDPDRPERKRAVQRRVEAKQENSTENNSSTTKVNTDKVAGENSSIVNKTVSFLKGLFS